VLRSLLSEVTGEAPELRPLAGAVDEVARWMERASPDDRLAGSYPLLTMLAVLIADWQMARQEAIARRLLEAGEGDPAFLAGKQAAARYFRSVVVPEATGLAGSAMLGAGLLYSVPDDAFAA